MNIPLRLSLALCLFSVKLVYASQGPVFVNPYNAAPEVVQTAASSPGNYVTQTVYGFLDFTTTIGNTVMVFSPQSAAVAPPEPPKPTKDISTNNVIETKPITAKNQAAIEPSKTQISNGQKPPSASNKVVSVAQVQSNPSPVAIKASPSTKVNVVESKSVINVAPKVVSKVQVVEAPPSKAIKQNIITKVEVFSGPTELPKPSVNTKVNVHTHKDVASVVSSVVQVKSDEEPAAVIGNNIGEPEYDFLSRQPSEVVEETYKVINLKPSSKFHLKHRPATEAKKAATKRPNGGHPTGLVTKLGGTVVKEGVTTVHETSVIGTYISGKYAQVLQSTSHISSSPKGKINPTPSLRILKTAAPSLGKANKHRHLELTPASAISEESVAPIEAQNSVKTTRKPIGAGSSFKRFKNRNKDADAAEGNKEVTQPQPQPSYKKPQKNRNQQNARASKPNTSSHSPQKTGRNRNRKTTSTTPSAHSEEPTTTAPAKRFSGRKNKQSRASVTTVESTSSINSNNNAGGYSRRGYKPRIQTSAVEKGGAASTSLYKFKLNRSPDNLSKNVTKSPGRWQYKTTSKPRVTIRKQNNDESTNNNDASGTTSSSPQEAAQPLINDVTPQARSDDVDSLEGSESIASIIDDDGSTENKLDTPAFPVETIKVEISTPPDLTDIYYEIATIKSPYTFQVGSVKNTRYITVTSTFEKSFETTPDPTPTKGTEPLTENILATTSNYGKDNNFLDSSIATLPPLYLATDMETPPLETLTETFSTTQTMLKTHILPVVRNGNDTASSTLVQTYMVTRMVTATKTLPPMDAYHFTPGKTLKEFNSHLDEAGSELHLELEFGDQNDQEDGQIRRSAFSDLDLANIGSDFDLSDVDRSKLLEGHLRLKKAHAPTKPSLNDFQTQALNPEQLQQLALLRLLNPAAAQGQVITTSKPVVKVETVYETFVLPVTQGQNTILSTISKIKGTFTKTDYEFGTSTLAPALPLPPVVPQIPQLPQIPQINPFLPQQQQQFSVTTSPVVQNTIVTQTNSKILKLTFGAKTAYTTVFSTTVVPTMVTTYMTTSVAVAPTAAAYPGYFPAPFPAGYPYVG